MEEKEQLQEKIEAYLEGSLSPQDAFDFEQNLKNNDALQDQLDQYRIKLQVYEYVWDEKWRQRIADLASASPQKNNWRSKPIKWLVLVVTMCLLGVIWYFYQKPTESKPSPVLVPQVVPLEPDHQISVMPDSLPKPIEKSINQKRKKEKRVTKEEGLDSIFKALLQTESMALLDIENRSYIGKDTSLYKSALSDFRALHYAECIQKLGNIQKGQKAYDAAQKLLGFAYLKKNNMPEAYAVFKKISLENTMTKAGREADWFILLSLLPQYFTQKKEVDRILNQIISESGTSHPSSTKAKLLKQQLNF